MLFCLVPEPVEGNAGASTSSATDKLKVQWPTVLVQSSSKTIDAVYMFINESGAKCEKHNAPELVLLLTTFYWGCFIQKQDVYNKVQNHQAFHKTHVYLCYIGIILLHICR